jgi:type IV pilus assembly protein PilF
MRLLALAVLCLLQACASHLVPTASGQSGADLTTESDESDARKRARIRTELASGYFEQGQSSVALDEVKQAIAADQSYAPALSLRGLILLQMGETNLAMDSLRRAANAAPRDPDIAHNLAWLLCQQRQYSESNSFFNRALAQPSYPGRARTLMAQGVCLARGGDNTQAEAALTRSFELDPSNPVTVFNLAQLLYKRGDFAGAQFHLRRLNSGSLVNAETLWLGIKVENRLGNAIGARQLGDQLRRQFPKSKELQAYERGAFDE